MSDILIFDDDPDVGSLLSEVLREHGFVAAHYTSADGIMQIIQQSRPRLVILDIMMPGLDGLSACRDIRSNMATRHIKVVVITAKQFEQDRATAQRLGVSLFINKPFNGAKLAQDIRALLGAPVVESPSAAPHPPMTANVFLSGIAIESLGLWILLDASRGLGRWVESHASFPNLCWMLLSRFEPGSIEELGACAPLLSAGSSVKLAGPDDADATLPKVAPRMTVGLPAHGMKAPLVFPQRAKSTPLLYPLREGEFMLAPGAMGTARYTHHPGSALAYRFNLHGRTIVYCPCNEINLESSNWNQHELNKFRSLFSNADLLIHGYGRSLDQPRPASGMGACAWEPVVDMATDAKTRNLLLMPLYEAPTQNVLEQAKARITALRSPMTCQVAVPGQSIVL